MRSPKGEGSKVPRWGLLHREGNRRDPTDSLPLISETVNPSCPLSPPQGLPACSTPVRKLMEAVTKFCFRILGKSWDAKDTRMKVVKKDKTTADSRKTRPRMMYTAEGQQAGLGTLTHEARGPPSPLGFPPTQGLGPHDQFATKNGLVPLFHYP